MTSSKRKFWFVPFVFPRDLRKFTKVNSYVNVDNQDQFQERHEAGTTVVDQDLEIGCILSRGTFTRWKDKCNV